MKESPVNLEEKIISAVESLKTGTTYTLHFIDIPPSPNLGYVEMAITRERQYVESWRSLTTGDNSADYKEVTLDEVIEQFNGTTTSVKTYAGFPSFKELLGPDARIFQKIRESLSFITWSSDRICLLFRSTNWAELEAYYGTYLRPTKH